MAGESPFFDGANLEHDFIEWQPMDPYGRVRIGRDPFQYQLDNLFGRSFPETVSARKTLDVQER